MPDVRRCPHQTGRRRKGSPAQPAGSVREASKQSGGLPDRRISGRDGYLHDCGRSTCDGPARKVSACGGYSLEHVGWFVRSRVIEGSIASIGRSRPGPIGTFSPSMRGNAWLID